METKIEWTGTLLPDGTMLPGYTFNPWWGCQKVSDACKFCYAETFANRYSPGLWKAGGPRRFFGDKHWNEPLKWNREAEKSDIRRKVFCASMADVFEDREDLVDPRARLFTLIKDTPNLDWLILTKRPENIERMLNQIGPDPEDGDVTVWDLLNMDGYLDNIWWGTTAENQEEADKRIPHLLTVPAEIHFLSCEPLFGHIDLTKVKYKGQGELNVFTDTVTVFGCPEPLYNNFDNKINWVITGGESGHKARITHPEWFRAIHQQCKDNNVAHFHKQNGEWSPVCVGDPKKTKAVTISNTGIVIKFPATGNAVDHLAHPAIMYKNGKKASGNLLDGKEYKEFPL